MIGGQIVAMGGGLGLEIGQVDIALPVAGDDDDPHPGHLRRGGIGAVRRRRNQAHIAMRLAARGVVGLDDQQARVLALGAGVGLQRDGAA